jgi:hypothetical protein
VAVGDWIFSKDEFQPQRSFITSTDGITWSFVNNPPLVDNESSNSYGTSSGYDVIWTGYIWIALGRWEDLYPLGDISLSEDGITWLYPEYTQIGNDGIPVVGANSIATNESYVIITGNWDGKTIVKSSSNRLGYSWTNTIKPAGFLVDNINLTSIVNSDILYVAGGTWEDNDGNLFANMASSTDGLNWSATYPKYISDEGGSIEGVTNAIGWNDLSGANSRFIAVGFWTDANWDNVNSDFYKKSICTSTDGRIWVGENNPDGAIGTGYCVKYVSYAASGGGDGGEFPPAEAFGAGGESGPPPTWWIGGNWTTGSISQSAVDSGGNILWNIPAFHPGNAVSGTCYGIAANSDGTIIVAVGKWQVPSGGSTITKTITYSIDYGVTWINPVNPSYLDPDDPNGIERIEIGNADSIAKCVMFDGNTIFVA